jgi:CubicO group peptidase (beta-lactamase class C family)
VIAGNGRVTGDVSSVISVRTKPKIFAVLNKILTLKFCTCSACPANPKYHNGANATFLLLPHSYPDTRINHLTTTMKFLSLLLLLLTASTGYTQDKAHIMDSVLRAFYADKKINGNFLVADKGEVVYSGSFGNANEDTKEPLQENSVFELASVSKQFTAMAIMLLVEEGKLNLDDPIAAYIPELEMYKGITVRHLVHHTGGLPDYMQLMDSLFDKTTIATNKDIITLFAKHQPAILFEPNTKFQYSNTGYALLGSIIEKASGMPFGGYLAKRIFKPLGMAQTLVYTRRYQPVNVDKYAYGYVYAESHGKYVLPDSLDETSMVIWLDGIVGDGCVNSTVKDLLKWDRALYTNELLPPKRMAEIFTGTTLADGTETEYGFGWFVGADPEYGTVANHGGGWPGYSTFIHRFMRDDKTIIVLQNHDDVILPFKSLRAILYNQPLPTTAVRKEITLHADQLQKLVGVYGITDDVALTVTQDDAQLFVQLTGQDRFPVYAESELFFFLKVVDAQIEFEPNADGAITKLYLLQNGNRMEAMRRE